MEFELSGPTLRELTRALVCLTKFGDEIDLSCSPHQIKLSSVNSSRSAFGLFVLNKSFFTNYKLTKHHYQSNLSFSLTAKALLAPLKPRSANSIESCTITLTEGDPDVHDGNESRLVIRLHCAHGIVKTHRLTYGKASALYAKANRANCTSTWSISGRTLKELTEHFSLKTSAQSGGTDELSFYHSHNSCTLKSFGGQGAADDPLLGRPLSTELHISVDDFDKYDVQGTPLVSISLKELKAIIVLADAVSTPLDAAFTNGGDPFLIQLSSDFYEADFVIATTNFDSNGSTLTSSGSPEAKRESSASRRSLVPLQRDDSTGTTQANDRPLFLPASQQDEAQGEGDDDEYDHYGGGDFDMAEIDAAEQAASQALSQRQASQHNQKILVPETSESRDTVTGSAGGSGSGSVQETDSRRTTRSTIEEVGMEPLVEEEEEEEVVDAGPSYPRTQLGPTQPQGGRGGKKPRWNLLPEEDM